MSTLVDSHRLRTASLNDPELMSQLVAVFLDDAGRQLLHLQRAVEAADAAAATAAAHRIGGAAGNLGADGLYEACRRLETRARDGCSDELREQAREVEDRFDRTKVELEAALEGARS